MFAENSSASLHMQGKEANHLPNWQLMVPTSLSIYIYSIYKYNDL